MKATCSHCGTTYRIDPRKVPSGGVRARCSRCGGIFAVPASGETSSAAPISASAPPQPEARPTTPSPTAHGAAAPQRPAMEEPARRADLEPEADTEAVGQVDLPELASAPRPMPPAHEPAPPAREESPPPATAAATSDEAQDGRHDPEAPPPERTSRPAPLFGRPDPHGKARRLARALISDIVVYHPERRERSIAAGTLRQEFREEIRKSWDEYVGQVGDSIARGTPYFREALNEILAGGRSVF